MALKSSLAFIALAISVAIAATPVMVEAQGGLIGGLLGLLRIDGVLYCTPNGNVGVNGTATPVFPNALVQLQCGSNVVTTTTTNASGVFSILLNPVQFLLSTLLSNCKLVVPTPLATCSVGLPTSGILQSALQLVGNVLVGVLSVTSLAPSGFQLLGA